MVTAWERGRLARFASTTIAQERRPGRPRSRANQKLHIQSKVPTMEMTTDVAVVSRARSGDADAFRQLVERHSKPMFRVAYRMTGNEHDADDVVQETFLRAYKQLRHFGERANFGTWLHRIAANCP